MSRHARIDVVPSKRLPWGSIRNPLRHRRLGIAELGPQLDAVTLWTTGVNAAAGISLLSVGRMSVVVRTAARWLRAPYRTYLTSWSHANGVESTTDSGDPVGVSLDDGAITESCGLEE